MLFRTASTSWCCFFILLLTQSFGIGCAFQMPARATPRASIDLSFAGTRLRMNEEGEVELRQRSLTELLLPSQSCKVDQMSGTDLGTGSEWRVETFSPLIFILCFCVALHGESLYWWRCIRTFYSVATCLAFETNIGPAEYCGGHCTRYDYTCTRMDSIIGVTILNLLNDFPCIQPNISPKYWRNWKQTFPWQKRKCRFLCVEEMRWLGPKIVETQLPIKIRRHSRPWLGIYTSVTNRDVRISWTGLTQL